MNNTSVNNTNNFELRMANMNDIDSIAEVWHISYVQSHYKLVPQEILQYRTLSAFKERVPERIPNTIVIENNQGRIIAFVTVIREQIEQIFVHPDFQGQGLAGKLIMKAENNISLNQELKGIENAYLYAIDGNELANKFYIKNGWKRISSDTHYAQILVDGENKTFPLACQRFEKKINNQI